MKSVNLSSFCKNCQNLEIERLFGVTDAKNTGNTDHIIKNNIFPMVLGECGLCDFFMECLPERCKVRNADGTWFISMNTTCASHMREPAKVAIWCYPPMKEKETLGTLWMVISSMEISRGESVGVSPIVCMDNARLSTHELQASSSRFNSAPISEWLKREIHTEQARWYGGGTGASLALTVIDCNTLKLVPLPNEERYATLSYVWGPSSLSSLDEMKGGRLPLHLPNTIQDSIGVCNELNIRYLWVDRYCIAHNNEHLRSLQISRMDEVYHNSFLTIVASAGKDPHFGLPGVSRQRNSNPGIEVFGLGRLQSLSKSSEIHSDIWATRAWTYQEALLSQRRLYFTNKGTFFESVDGLQEESGSVSKSRLEQLLPGHLRSELSVLGFVRDSNDRKYSIEGLHVWTCIFEYSTRTLSYQSDILNALLGVLAYFRRRHGVCHLWGIPFFTSVPVSPPFSSLSFERSLRWLVIGLSSRRAGFPSWSWTGHNGQVRLLDVNRGIVYEAPTANGEAIFIEVELASGQLLKWSDYQTDYANLQDYTQARSSNENPDQPSRFIHLEALTSRIVGKHRGQDNIHYYSIDESTLAIGMLKFFGSVESPSYAKSNVEIEESLPVGSLLALHFPQLYSTGLRGGTDSKSHLSFWNDGCALLIRNLGDHWERVCLLGSRRDLKREEVHEVRRKIRLG